MATNAAELKVVVLDFACYIAKLTRSKLTGVFLENLQGETAPVMKRLYGMTYVETIVAGDIAENDTILKMSEQNIQLFKQACESKGVNYSIHRDRGVPVAEIIDESRFADLVIVDAELSFHEKQNGIPTGFIKNLLEKSECPVVIAPSGFDNIEEILYAYDGTSASVFAIKQFNYLFPEFADKKITVLQVDENEGVPVTEKGKIGELLQSHYSSIGFNVLKGKARNELFNYLLGKKNTFVVMGAFGRNRLSDFFRHSTAELLLGTLNLPIFISHH